MKYLLLIFTAAWLLFGCETAPIKTVTPEERLALRNTVTAIALNDKCATTAHDVQGTPPKSYLRGIALTYARAICNPRTDSFKAASQALGDPAKDALAHYGMKPQSPEERLNMTYALLLGSAARETSWRWCLGKDPGAKNTTAETCEAGLYQTSYNSRHASPVLPVLYAQFKMNDSGCFAAEYKGSTVCSQSDMKNWGEGEGVEFQALSKECPGFASEYHAVMVRVNRKHYGPINSKLSQIKPACVSMFEKIRQAIVKDPSICGAL